MKSLVLAGAVAICIVAGIAGVWRYRQIREARSVPASPAAEPAKAEWLTRLYSQNPREVEAASEEVRRLGAQALPAIQETLRDPQSEAQALKGALKACGLLGRVAAPAVADVADVLSEPGLTAEAAVALSHMGPESFRPLRAALSSGDPMVRRESLRSIGKLKERASLDSERVVPILVERMKDEDEGVRAVAATYLGIIHQDAAESIPALTAALEDADAEVRRSSAAALASFDAVSAAPALPALRKAARDENPDVAREAGRAIVKLEGR